MIERDPKCVFVADENGEARIIASWLTGLGINADVMDEMTRGGFEGLTAILPGGISARGLEVWVTDPDRADEARELLKQRAEDQRAKQARNAARAGDVIITCEDCGKQSPFPASLAGNIEQCPHCGSYIDIPDPDGESFDVGAADGDEAED
ncbi:MAG: hypothetical protein U0746_11885 [Gemmataceae bacterium]